MNAAELINLYWEYSQPRHRDRHLVWRKHLPGPKGYERKGEIKSDIRFEAWLRVVTEPGYEEARKFIDNGYPCPAFEQQLERSLIACPFVHRGPQDKARDLRGALIPVSAATIYAGVHQTTIMRWVDRGLKHEKRGAYYWVSVQDLERFFNLKRRHKVAKHTNARKKSYKSESNGDTLTAQVA